MSRRADIPTVPFSHGHQGAIPIVGFGTWRTTGNEAYKAVRTALDDGYRSIDTAVYYRNQAAIGRALADCGVARDELFVTSKIYPSLTRRADATLDQTLAELGLDHLDLWLIHWSDGTAHADLWRALLRARADGRARAVGVSNYTVAQVDEITRATGVAPAANQVRWAPAPGVYDPRLATAMEQRGVVLEGWGGLKLTDLNHPVLRGIAQQLGVSTAQVVIRWHVQHQVVVIPKSATPSRIAANLDVFDFTLTAELLGQIDALAR